MTEKEDKAGTLPELGQTLPCYLAELLQQLMQVNACRPSEKTPVRQGEGQPAGGCALELANPGRFFTPASLSFFPRGG